MDLSADDEGSAPDRERRGRGGQLDLGIYPITLSHLFMGVPEAISVAGGAFLDGLTESPVNPMGATIEVLDTIDEVRRLVYERSLNA